jgi:hypothetical protein
MKHRMLLFLATLVVVLLVERFILLFSPEAFGKTNGSELISLSRAPIEYKAVAASVPITGVSISGPAIGGVDVAYTYTAIVAPQDSSPPIRYIWSPTPAEGQRRATAKYVWSTPGKKLINLTVYNKQGSATALYTVTISGPITPVLDVEISGGAIAVLNRSYTYTATTSPFNATPPIDHIWNPTPAMGQHTPNATFAWGSLGDKTITVTAINAGGTEVANHHVTVVNVPMQDVEIDGPSTSTLYQTSRFSAIISPTEVSWPVTYTWTPDPVNGQDTDVAIYNWDSLGNKTVTVVAENPCSTAANTKTITVTFGPRLFKVNLPFILHRWPPLPDTPQLSPINNSGGGSTYTITWSTASLADAYILEESTNRAFLDVDRIYTGTANFYVADGGGAGRYYYRIKGLNNWGEGSWSNVELVDVLGEREPNTWTSLSNGPLASGLLYSGYPDENGNGQAGPWDYPWDCFYIDTEHEGNVAVDLFNHAGLGPQLLLYIGSDTNLVRQVYEVPYHLEYFGPAERYYICIYSVGGNTTVPYSLRVIYH